MSWVVIYRAAHSIEAHLIKGLLEQEEIPVFIAGEALGGAVGELPADVTQVDIRVPAEFAARAREIALEFEELRRSEKQ